MAWVKIPAEHHPIFLAALPRDPRISTIPMFGGIVAKLNGYMMAGLFERSALVRLSAADQRVALALDGAEPFDPMSSGRTMRDTILLPEDVMDDPAQLRGWLARARDFTASLPARPTRSGKPKPRAQATAKPRAQATAKPRAQATAKPRARATATLRAQAAAKPPRKRAPRSPVSTSPRGSPRRRSSGR